MSNAAMKRPWTVVTEVSDRDTSGSLQNGYKKPYSGFFDIWGVIVLSPISKALRRWLNNRGGNPIDPKENNLIIYWRYYATGSVQSILEIIPLQRGTCDVIALETDNNKR